MEFVEQSFDHLDLLHFENLRWLRETNSPEVATIQRISMMNASGRSWSSSVHFWLLWAVYFYTEISLMIQLGAKGKPSKLDMGSRTFSISAQSVRNSKYFIFTCNSQMQSETEKSHSSRRSNLRDSQNRSATQISTRDLGPGQAAGSSSRIREQTDLETMWKQLGFV